MNCVSLFMLLFVRQMKTIYLLKLDNQAVDKRTLKIVLVQMLTTLTCAYCVTIVWIYQEDQRHQKSGEGGQRTEMTRKQRDGCHDLLIFVKTLFTLNDWFPLGQRALTITEI